LLDVAAPGDLDLLAMRKVGLEALFLEALSQAGETSTAEPAKEFLHTMSDQRQADSQA